MAEINWNSTICSVAFKNVFAVAKYSIFSIVLIYSATDCLMLCYVSELRIFRLYINILTCSVNWYFCCCLAAGCLIRQSCEFIFRKWNGKVWVFTNDRWLIILKWSWFAIQRKTLLVVLRHYLVQLVFIWINCEFMYEMIFTFFLANVICLSDFCTYLLVATFDFWFESSIAGISYR